MGRFYVKGICVDIKETKFKTGAKQKLVFIEETRNCKKPVIYTHKIEFNGIFANEIPNDMDIIGATVVCIGTLAGKEWKEGTIETCKGEKFIMIDFPTFEGNSNENLVRNQVEDEDIPF